MKILDRYILVNFLLSYLIMAFVLIGLYVLVDLTLNSDEFTEHDQKATRTLGDIVDYYGHQAFVYFDQLAGIITLASAGVTLTTMNRRNEMTAVLASGVSLYRIIWPVLVLGLVFNALALLDKELIIPRIADKLVRSHDEVTHTKEFGIWYYRMYDTHSADDMFTVAGVSRPDRSAVSPADTSGLLQLPAGDARSRLAVGQLRIDDELAVLAGEGPEVRAYVKVVAPGEGQGAAISDRSVHVTTVGVQQAGRAKLPDATGGGLADIRPDDRVRPVLWPMYYFIAARFKEPAGLASYQMEDVAVFKRHPRLMEPLSRIRSDHATWDAQQQQWKFGDSAVIMPLTPTEPDQGFAPVAGVRLAASSVRTESEPRQIRLRHSSQHWMQYMSTAELKRLSDTRAGRAAGRAQSVIHIRFTQPIINMILLLLGVPFVLTRVPGGLWEGILRSLLFCGSCFVLSFISQQISGDARDWAVVAAWLPVVLFGPLAVLMLDSVKT